jgi:hypothetical protein
MQGYILLRLMAFIKVDVKWELLNICNLANQKVGGDKQQKQKGIGVYMKSPIGYLGL